MIKKKRHEKDFGSIYAKHPLRARLPPLL